MFLVFNKEKICAYAVSILTVCLLFLTASTMNSNTKEDIQETLSNSKKLLPIYNVKTNDKKVALTMNCAWSQLQMG